VKYYWHFAVLFAVAAAVVGCGESQSANPPPVEPRTRSSMQNQTVSVRLLDAHGQLTAPTNVAKVVKTDAEWRKQLTDEQFRIARGQGTERAFCGAFYDHKKPGIYYCVCCDLPLFSAAAKFDSGTGWPSFFTPIAKENVLSRSDTSHGMTRTEILCARCDGHLGHVFEDGPRPTGLRYCLNSASLVFKESPVKVTTP
jgi:methionine-R-sulfoxide reductase